jgi:hypothetical protein
MLMLWLGLQANPNFCNLTQLDHDCRISDNPGSQGKKMKNQKLNHLRQTIGRCAVALSIPVCLLVTVMTAAPANAIPAVAVTTSYIGTDGNYDGSCSVTSCDSASACRVLTNIKDVYFPRKQCSGGLNLSGGGPCDQTMQKCRDIEHYDNSSSNCHGVLQYIERHMKSSCG